MATPERIRADAREAEAQLAALGEQARNAASAPAPSTTDAAPAATLDERAPNDVPHPNAVEAPAAVPESGPITPEAYAALLQKYETLQGLHGRDRGKLNQIESEVDGMRRMLEAQQVALANTTAQRAPEAATVSKPELLTSDEIKEFGEDLIDVIRRVAREEWYAPIQNILTDVQRLRTSLSAVSSTLQSTSTVVADAAEAQFNQRMDKLVTSAQGVPDWQDINEMHLTRGDSNFVDWLKQIGQDSDEPRQAVLVRAYQRKDADKCAGLFNAYKEAKGISRGNGSTAPAVPLAPTVNPADAIVSPSPVAPQVPSTQRGKDSQKVWTLAEITKIYDDNTKGLNKTDAQRAEYKRLTAAIDVATKEGRIKA